MATPGLEPRSPDLARSSDALTTALTGPRCLENKLEIENFSHFIFQSIEEKQSSIINFVCIVRCARQSGGANEACHRKTGLTDDASIWKYMFSTAELSFFYIIRCKGIFLTLKERDIEELQTDMFLNLYTTKINLAIF